jgi:hypothetical protein
MPVLLESVTHIEDLDLDEFIQALRELPRMKAQEKLDGANLWVGVDEEGRFFTSREGKHANAERKFKVVNWPDVSAHNQFKAAHSALEQKQEIIKQHLQPGSIVEVEVLFGQQPNAVSYNTGGSQIAILRGVEGTSDETAAALAKSLKGHRVDARFNAVSSDDGENLKLRPEITTFEFVEPKEIDPSKLQVDGLDAAIQKLEKFLKEPSAIAGKTKYELLTLNLNQVSKDDRPKAKEARAELQAALHQEHKLPIKKLLINKLVKSLRAQNGDNLEVEGIVLRAEDGSQLKIVDRDVFTAVNRFNQAVRAELQGPINTTDPEAGLEARGGLVGDLKIKIADTLGNRELAKSANARKLLASIKGETPADTIRNMAKGMPDLDDFQGLRLRILALISNANKDLGAKLKEFKESREEYKLRLKDGREFGLSDDTVKKTLASFAETKKNLTELFNKVKGTDRLDQLLAVLYGVHAKAAHEKVNEALLEARIKKIKTRRASFGEIDLSDFDRKDSFQLFNGYFAMAFMTMFMFHVQDKLALRKLRDRKNYMLKRWSADMSPLNHWGYMFWRNSRPDVKKHMTKQVQAELFKVTRHIPAPWWKFLHMDFSLDKQVKIDWADHRKTLQRLIDLSGLRSERLNSLLDWMVRWPELTQDEQIKASNRLYMYALQFIPRSFLFTRFRALQPTLLMTSPATTDPMVFEGSLLKEISRLSEDEGAAVAPAAPSTAATPGVSTTASAIASRESKILRKPVARGRVIVPRKRSKAAQRLSLQFPDPRKDS